MPVWTTQWEDKPNHRQVELDIAYAIDNDDVEVHQITPQRITFKCPNTGSTLRQIGVHTTKGRDLLARHYRERVGIDQIRLEISQQTLEPNF